VPAPHPAGSFVVNKSSASLISSFPDTTQLPCATLPPGLSAFKIDAFPYYSVYSVGNNPSVFFVTLPCRASRANSVVNLVQAPRFAGLAAPWRGLGGKSPAGSPASVIPRGPSSATLDVQRWMLSVCFSSLISRTVSRQPASKSYCDVNPNSR